MPKTAVDTTVMETRNTAAAAKTGRHRAASHNSIGNSKATGTTVSQDSCGRAIEIPVITASATSATAPSISSLRGGGCRTAAARPITRGATMTMPIASDANQCAQVLSNDADGPFNNLYVAVPPIPETAVPTIAARNKPRTWRTRSMLKSAPKYHLINQAVITASTALLRPKAVPAQSGSAINSWVAIVAAVTPTATGHPARRRPSAMRTPDETPAAGQKTATPAGFKTRPTLSRAARK